jgi:hypothetical protein
MKTGNGAVLPTTVLSNTSPHVKTFHYLGKEQIFKVPAGVTAIEVVVSGASGGSSTGGRGRGSAGGNGGRVKATIPVKAGEKLAVAAAAACIPGEQAAAVVAVAAVAAVDLRSSSRTQRTFGTAKERRLPATAGSSSRGKNENGPSSGALTFSSRMR